MDEQLRSALIDQLDKSFLAMPTWVQVAVIHAIGAPAINPATGKPFRSFRECISVASDDTLETLRDDFDDNGDLIPETPRGEVNP